jgi:hypothetical protein
MVIQKNRVSLAFASALFRVRQPGHGRLRVGVRQYLPRLSRPRGPAGHALIEGPMPDKVTAPHGSSRHIADSNFVRIGPQSQSSVGVAHWQEQRGG